jgi:hypothetical protein
VTTAPFKTPARYDAVIAFCLIIGGLLVLCDASRAAAAATSHAVGTAVLLRPASVAAISTLARRSNDHVRTDRDAILLRGLVSSPLALPPMHPRATRRYTATPVASLSENRRPQLAVEVERLRVHVKRREIATVAPFARELRDDVRVPVLRDTFASVASRRGPPRAAGSRTA